MQPIDALAKLRGLEKLNLMTDDEVVLHLKTLLTCAADALEGREPAEIRPSERILITELRHAAE